MIYDLGLRLGVTDFTNVTDSNHLATQLQHDLSGAVSNCILCLLRAHSSHEEQDYFSAIRPFDEDAVDIMLVEHREIKRRIYWVSKTCNELLDLTDPARRIELGDRLTLEANDLFAMYLAHLNNEEATLVPVMWERFSDDQLRALRAQFYNAIPLERFEEWMRWTMPALNLNELTILLSGMKSDPAPSRYEDALRIAKQTLDPDRWATLSAKLA